MPLVTRRGMPAGESDWSTTSKCSQEQLWPVGIREIYADGSFVEDKDHPNDIDGYFVCGLRELASGELGATAEPARSIQGLDMGSLYRESLIAATQRNNSQCGIDIAWNSTRMCQASDWVAASETSTGTNSNFRQPSVNLDAMGPPEESSKSNMEVRHDSQ